MGYKVFEQFFSQKRKAIEDEITRENDAKDLERMMEDPNYDPVNRKSYSKQPGVKKFEENYEKPRALHNKEVIAENLVEIPEKYEDIGDLYDYENITDGEEVDKYCQQTTIEQFNNEDTLTNFIIKNDEIDENDFDNNPDPLDLKRFDRRDEELLEKLSEEKEKFQKSLKKIKLYTLPEKMAIKNDAESYIKEKKQPIEGKKMSAEQLGQLMDEYRLLFPEDFARAINQKVIPAEKFWKKETFNGKEILVSYWPGPKNPKIKYVLNLNGEKNYKIESDEKVFVNTSINKNGNNYRSKDGVILIFCSRLKKKK